MTTHTPPASNDRPQQGAEAAEDFTTSDGLRALLTRLHKSGEGAWTHDPVATELMVFAAEKYAALARKHSLDPWEAAAAAFDVMRTRAARTARDPWGVITHAVRITCIAEERGQGLLCSVHQARRAHIAAFHDPERFGDRENPLTDYHPALRVTDSYESENTPDPARDPHRRATSATAAVEEAIELVTALGWPADTARSSIDYVTAALAHAGNRRTAFESLRRDAYALAFLDLPVTSWTTLLRTLLGHPHPGYATTSIGRGILLRLVLDESGEDLLEDHDLVLSISLAAPSPGGRRR
ncbi:hypothetical protein [Nesterenkonia alkaliphila]|uniref:Serine/arginine repetitive matrix protein 2 n=1 Tax=Nesterenkonia alkaliphila TaxID=1463631 RepID=A0A7K1ULV2_9MICC|nr:hypothetical protein [Nesterenkonia alkaliphila]MVT27449.1 hypothetical protein [Nesterenkonia alkaliphila]GFZ89704.1 hypothetical protein GCM10011359_18740 [Nesterenkonia alkaliphila]